MRYGNVVSSVPVEVEDGEEAARGRVYSGRAKRAETISEQNADAARGVRRDEIDFPVTVEIAGCDRRRRAAGACRKRGVRRESAVADTQQNRHGRWQLAADRDVELLIAVEVRYHKSATERRRG